MKKPNLVRWGLFMLFTWSVGQMVAQDPFFTHFYHSRSDFNPALVGIKGAFSIQAAFKDQWRANSQVPYQTYQITIEEGLPCSLFDYGLSASRDVEGDGFLQT
ncbi:MAG: type IX secretion system membrane protein PorP/SprF, partial [Bacteroidota bacterium]